MTGAHAAVPAAPIGPGRVLEKYLIDGERITQETLAKAMGVSRFSVNQIVNGRRTITAEMALRLSHVLSTSPEFWLNLQREVDLYEAKQKLGKQVRLMSVLREPKEDASLFHDAEAAE